MHAMEIAINTGEKGVAAGPMMAQLDKPIHAAVLVSGSHHFETQSDAQNRVWWWTDGLPANQTLVCTLNPSKVPHRVRVEKRGEDVIEVTIDGKPFTALNFKKTEPRVYLYPLIGPTGVGVTRDFPMKYNPIESRENKPPDHPHHRSLWTAYGDIRIKEFDKKGFDFWAETGAEARPEGMPPAVGKGEQVRKPVKSLPKQVLTRIVRTVSGPVFGQIEAEIEWRTPDGERVFTENRTYTFFAGNQNQRIIDQTNVFKFNDMDVKFADTKEGGILSLRLAVTMDEKGVSKPEPMHGQMTNSKGGVGAKECWGKPADWCDYVGPLAGQTVGVAVFDNPGNFRHPTRWHIRDYGLYTANPFSISGLTDGKLKEDGSRVFKKGESAEFNYRVVLHKSDTRAAHIPDQWSLYSSQPKISVK
jgi:hypothetical protein